ncbi:MAG: CPBP family intramembrane metalloprotease [Gemmatimonadaceae bacterium]|nr:CPBP family intramembrane metalloprotease [Gemmatimonadaceae bacterium]
MSDTLLDRAVYDRPGHLRWGWRIVLFLLAGIAASNVGVPLVQMLLPAVVTPWVNAALQCAAVAVATWYAVSSLEHGGWARVALDLRAWRPSLLLAGAAVGAVAIGVPIALLVLRGDLTFTDAPAGGVLRALLLSVVILAPAAMTEELMFRGYPFVVLRERWGWPVAVALTSVTFGALHLGNPGVTPLAIANVVSAGVFLAGVRLVTGSLAAAWAAHFAWNWTMSAGFHTAVSGLPFETPGYRLVDSGPDWLSGGAWGPEGGVVAAVGMIGTFTVLSQVTKRSRRAAPGLAAPTPVSFNTAGPLDRREHQA